MASLSTGLVATALALACATLAAGWALHGGGSVAPRPVAGQAGQDTTASVPAAPPGTDWTRLLGSSPPPTAPASALAVVPSARPALRLLGVVAAGQHGLALIAIDDQPARVFRVGTVVHGDVLLHSVSAGSVVLGRLAGRPGTGPGVRPGSAQAPLQAAAPATMQVLTLVPNGPGVQSQPAQHLPTRQFADSVDDTSPIVPPHADMRAPAAAQAGTAGSHWQRQRELAAAPAGDQPAPAPPAADAPEPS